MSAQSDTRVVPVQEYNARLYINIECKRVLYLGSGTRNVP